MWMAVLSRGQWRHAAMRCDVRPALKFRRDARQRLLLPLHEEERCLRRNGGRSVRAFAAHDCNRAPIIRSNGFNAPDRRKRGCAERRAAADLKAEDG